MKKLKSPRPPKGLPARMSSGSIWWLLYRYANGLAALYGAPVYLCGSALRSGNDDPRDYDIRIMLPDAAFARRYGDPAKWQEEGYSGNYSRIRWRWADDCVKQSRRGMVDTRLVIDFQVYPMSHAMKLYGKKKRVRIDTRGR